MGEDTSSSPESRGRILYTSYGRGVDFVNFRGEPMPSFDELSERQRQAWIGGAQTIWDLATTGRATLWRR